MAIRLTRDADYMVCSLYKEYLSRVKNGSSKSKAKCFIKSEINSLVPKVNSDDVGDLAEELKSKGLLSKDILDNVEFTSDGIIYMENRFLNKADKVLEYLSYLIP